MKKNFLQNNKIFISAILIMILSILNFYNLKDKAFIKIEKYFVTINNELLTKEFATRIKLKNLDFSRLKIGSNPLIRNEVNIDTSHTFYVYTNWNVSAQDEDIKKIKKLIYDEFLDSFKKEKKKIQTKFLFLFNNIAKSTDNFKMHNFKFDETRLDEIFYLKEVNEYLTKIQIISIIDYLSHANQLNLINEIENIDDNFVSISKTFEKKEYLIFFALIFNQLIIFIIIFFFYRSIPANITK
jgi:hypothetical protein